MEGLENFYFILLGREVVPATVNLFGEWYQDPINRIVRRRKIGNSLIATDFLAINHAMVFDAQPILFETMIFGGRLDRYQTRCSTYEQALLMHQTACKAVVQHGFDRLRQYQAR